MKLKREAKQHLQGIMLIILGYICLKVHADGAAVFMWFVGVMLLLGK